MHCRATISLPQRPQPNQKGWPRTSCSTCNKVQRLGAATCIACNSAMSKCACTAGAPQPGENSQSRRLFAMLGETARGALPVPPAAPGPDLGPRGVASGLEARIARPSGTADDPATGLQAPTGATACNGVSPHAHAATPRLFGATAGGGRLGEVAAPLTSQCLGARSVGSARHGGIPRCCGTA